MIGQGEANQLQMDQSAPVYCLKFGYLSLEHFHKQVW